MYKDSDIRFRIDCDCGDQDNCKFNATISLEVGDCQSPNGTVWNLNGMVCYALIILLAF